MKEGGGRNRKEKEREKEGKKGEGEGRGGKGREGKEREGEGREGEGRGGKGRGGGRKKGGRGEALVSACLQVEEADPTYLLHWFCTAPWLSGQVHRGAPLKHKTGNHARHMTIN